MSYRQVFKDRRQQKMEKKSIVTGEEEEINTENSRRGIVFPQIVINQSFTTWQTPIK